MTLHRVLGQSTAQSIGVSYERRMTKHLTKTNFFCQVIRTFFITNEGSTISAISVSIFTMPYAVQKKFLFWVSAPFRFADVSIDHHGTGSYTWLKHLVPSIIHTLGRRHWRALANRLEALQPITNVPRPTAIRLWTTKGVSCRSRMRTQIFEIATVRMRSKSEE